MSRRPLRLVHVADLHLDSPPRGLREAGGRAGELLRDAAFGSLDRLLEVARAREADLVLVAGDIFDAATRSLRARLGFRERLGALAADGIPSYVAFGNHDHAGLWARLGSWPAGVHVFPADAPATFTREVPGVGAVHVHGLSHGRDAEDDNLARALPRARGGGLHLGVLHANVGGAPGHADYAPCSLGDLAATGYHYVALGHVHGFQVLAAEAPCVVYPGCAQGRHVGEAGPRGGVFAEVPEGGPPVVEHLDTAPVRFEQVVVEVGGIDDLGALEARLVARLGEVREAAGRPVVVRLVLEGVTALHPELAVEGADDELAERLEEQVDDLVLEPLRLRTRPEVPAGLREDPGSFVGEVPRERARLAADPVARAELREALAPLFGDARFRELLGPVDDVRLDDWLERAEALLVEQALGGRG